MANGLFSSSDKKKRDGSTIDFSLEEQIDQIRADISSLAKVLSDRSTETTKEVKARARDARDTAEAGFGDLLANGEDLIADLRSRYASTEKQIRNNVREHPLATLGIAAAAGVLLAAFLRR